MQSPRLSAMTAGTTMVVVLRNMSGGQVEGTNSDLFLRTVRTLGWLDARLQWMCGAPDICPLTSFVHGGWRNWNLHRTRLKYPRTRFEKDKGFEKTTYEPHQQNPTRFVFPILFPANTISNRGCWKIASHGDHSTLL